MKKQGFVFLNTVILMSLVFLLVAAILTNILICLNLKENSEQVELGMQAMKKYLAGDKELDTLKINTQQVEVTIANKKIKKNILQVLDKNKDKALVNLIYYEE